MLACIGSQLQTIFRPSRFISRSSGGKTFSIFCVPSLVIRVMRPASFSGFKISSTRLYVVEIVVGTDLDADRVQDAAKKFNVGAVRLPGAFADPEQMGGAVVPVAGGRIDPGQRFFIGEEQGLVRGKELGLVICGVSIEMPMVSMNWMAWSICLARRS